MSQGVRFLGPVGISQLPARLIRPVTISSIAGIDRTVSSSHSVGTWEGGHGGQEGSVFLFVTVSLCLCVSASAFFLSSLTLKISWGGRRPGATGSRAISASTSASSATSSASWKGRIGSRCCPKVPFELLELLELFEHGGGGGAPSARQRWRPRAWPPPRPRPRPAGAGEVSCMQIC